MDSDWTLQAEQLEGQNEEGDDRSRIHGEEGEQSTSDDNAGDGHGDEEEHHG